MGAYVFSAICTGLHNNGEKIGPFRTRNEAFSEGYFRFGPLFIIKKRKVKAKRRT